MKIDFAMVAIYYHHTSMIWRGVVKNVTSYHGGDENEHAPYNFLETTIWEGNEWGLASFLGHGICNPLLAKEALRR